MLAIGALIFGLGLFVFALTTPASRAALALATTRKPESLIELSFNAPTYLPKTVTAGQMATFSYNLSNHVGATKHVTAEITITENGRSRLLERDDFTLANDGSRDTTVQFVVAHPDTEVLVTVSLVGEPESIRFRSHS